MPSVMRKIFCPEAERSTFTFGPCGVASRSEEHTSELQSLTNLVCRLLLEKKTMACKQTPTKSSSSTHVREVHSRRSWTRSDTIQHSATPNSLVRIDYLLAAYITSESTLS